MKLARCKFASLRTCFLVDTSRPNCRTGSGRRAGTQEGHPARHCEHVWLHRQGHRTAGAARRGVRFSASLGAVSCAHCHLHLTRWGSPLCPRVELNDFVSINADVLLVKVKGLREWLGMLAVLTKYAGMLIILAAQEL